MDMVTLTYDVYMIRQMLRLQLCFSGNNRTTAAAADVFYAPQHAHAMYESHAAAALRPLRNIPPEPTTTQAPQTVMSTPGAFLTAQERRQRETHARREHVGVYSCYALRPCMGMSTPPRVHAMHESSAAVPLWPPAMPPEPTTNDARLADCDRLT